MRSDAQHPSHRRGQSRAGFERALKRKAQFLVDESLGLEAAQIIRELGWNAKYVGEVGLSGRDDNNIYSFAWKDDRIILTHDRDFLDDRQFPFYRNLGVIVLPGGAGSSGGLEQALADVLDFVAPYRGAHSGIKLEISDDRVWDDTGVHQRRRPTCLSTIETRRARRSLGMGRPGLRANRGFARGCPSSLETLLNDRPP